MAEWTLDDIERQAARGGVNRQQAQQLVDEVRRLRNAIRQHRHMWDTTVGRWDPARDDANDTLWALLDDNR
jgi:hypothetical protein